MISYPTILEIISSFYQIAMKDIMIGYHFRVIEDFDSHLPRIADFWNLQLNGELHDKSHLPFEILKVHIPLKINKGEVYRWTKLFGQNLDAFVVKKAITDEDKMIWMKKVDLFATRLLATI